jgi:hypothetical protein
MAHDVFVVPGEGYEAEQIHYKPEGFYSRMTDEGVYWPYDHVICRLLEDGVIKLKEDVDTRPTPDVHPTMGAQDRRQGRAVEPDK